MDRALVQTGHTPRTPHVRTSPDRCPTAIDLHEAADGFLARLRLTGGRMSPAAARGIGALAEPGATIELTGRANLQLRALDGAAGAALAAALLPLGLLPSSTHERARTILARPAIGRLTPGAAAGQAHDALLAALDLAVQSVPSVAALSGRVMTVVADAAGHPLAAEADLLLVTAAGKDATVHLGRARIGRWPLATVAVPAAAMLGLLAEACAAASVWRLRELPPVERAALLTRARQLAGAAGLDGEAADTEDGRAAAELGVVEQGDGGYAVRAHPVLGRVSGEQLAAVAAVAAAHGTDLRVDVDRTITLVDLGSAEQALHVADELAAAGLAIDTASAWRGLSACAGTGCRSTLADVRAAARLRSGLRRAEGRPEHFVGCERRCGASQSGHTIVAVAGDTPTMLAQRAARLPQEATP